MLMHPTASSQSVFWNKLKWQHLVISVLILLAACNPSAEPDRMAVMQSPRLPDMQSSICVRNVTGGEDDAKAYGHVDNKEFRDALIITLRNAHSLAQENECRFHLDVNILGLSRPGVIGASTVVISNINYKLFDKENSPVLLETVTSSYTADMSESLGGVKRAQRASEGSIRTNLSEFLQRLSKTKTL